MILQIWCVLAFNRMRNSLKDSPSNRTDYTKKTNLSEDLRHHRKHSATFCKIPCIQEASRFFFKIKGTPLKKATPHSLSFKCEGEKIQKLNEEYETQRKELQPEACLPRGRSAVFQSRGNSLTLYTDGVIVLARQNFLDRTDSS